MPTFADYEGKVLTMEPEAGGMKCLACCFGCGTPLTGVMKIEGDSLAMTENTYCFCLKASPCPCLGCCCCDGPHTVNYKMKKQSDKLYVGDKSHSQWNGGCCVGCCHNDGDKMELENGVWYFTPGNNPTAPPCFKGKKFMHMEKVGGGAPPMANATMER